MRVPVKVKALGGIGEALEAEFLVDTGATDCLMPAAALRKVGAEAVGTTACELADGSLHEYAFTLARLEFMGEVTAGRVIFGPDAAKLPRP